MKNIVINLVFKLCLIIFCGNAWCQNLAYKYVEKNTAEGTKLGVFDSKLNKDVLPPVYDNILDFTNGKFIVMKAGKVGIVDTLNKIIIPISYEETTGFIDDRVFVLKNKKWAMLNETGVRTTDFLYDKILGYQDGVARVEIAGKTGYIDKFGNVILQCKFTDGYDCYGNFILVYENSFESIGYEYVTKDQKGNIINRQDIGNSGKLPIVFNIKGQIIYKGIQGEIIKYNNGKSTFIVEGSTLKYNNPVYHKLVNKQGVEVISFDKKYKFNIRPEWIQINSSTGYGIMDFEGNVLWQPNFKDLTNYEFNNKELAKIFFNNGEFLYIDKKANCFEFEGIKCPDKE